MKPPANQEEMQNLAANIRLAMQERAWSQLDLAAAAGVQQSLISRILGAKSDPSLSAVSNVAKALRKSLDDLLSPPPRKKLRNAS